MKLLKLVYIAHGFYLAIIGDDLINEAVQAWKFGPVIPSVYHKFKIYGNEEVTATANFDTPPWSTDPMERGMDISDLSAISDDDKLFLDKIWEVYGRYNGIQLSNMTHQDQTPWDQTWKTEGNKKRHASIPNTLIRDHYKQLLGQPELQNV